MKSGKQNFPLNRNKKGNPSKTEGFSDLVPPVASERASERCNASRLKVVPRNGGCPGLSGGRSDSPHRGIPQQHIMRLWWNQSVTGELWVVASRRPIHPSIRPSIRPSIHPSIPSVHTFIRTSVKRRASASIRVASVDNLHRLWSRPRRRRSSVIIREYAATRILAPKKLDVRTASTTHMSSSDFSFSSELNTLTIFEDNNQTDGEF